jgi:putative restriction endonuclease
MIWKNAVRNAILRVCKLRSDKTFTRHELISRELDNIKSETDSNGKTPEQTLSRILQDLRDIGEIKFLGRGHYRLLRKI